LRPRAGFLPLTGWNPAWGPNADEQPAATGGGTGPGAQPGKWTVIRGGT
jgi:hypothetical protein